MGGRAPPPPLLLLLLSTAVTDFFKMLVADVLSGEQAAIFPASNELPGL